MTVVRKCLKSAVFGDPDNLWEVILWVGETEDGETRTLTPIPSYE